MTGKKRIVIRPHAIERLKREKVYKVDRNTLIITFYRAKKKRYFRGEK